MFYEKDVIFLILTWFSGENSFDFPTQFFTEKNSEFSSFFIGNYRRTALILSHLWRTAHCFQDMLILAKNSSIFQFSLSTFPRTAHSFCHICQEQLIFLNKE